VRVIDYPFDAAQPAKVPSPRVIWGSESLSLTLSTTLLAWPCPLFLLLSLHRTASRDIKRHNASSYD
jgi:hypothetical protein